MSSDDVLKEMLDLVDARNGDNYGTECCSYCFGDPWHQDRYANGGHGAVGDAIWTSVAAPRCGCPCHRARRVLGIVDDIFDRNYPASS